MAGRLAKLRGLPREERRLLARVWVYLLLARIGLRLLPFPRVKAAACGPRTPPRQPDWTEINRMKRLVDIAAGRQLVAMTCLPRALVLQRVLAERGYVSELEIGVRKEGDTLTAHAWLECQGEPLGEPEDLSSRYATLVGAD